MTEQEINWLQGLIDEVEAGREDKLNDWEKNFMNSMIERFGQYGAKTMVSPKQWTALNKIAEKLGY